MLAASPSNDLGSDCAELKPYRCPNQSDWAHHHAVRDRTDLRPASHRNGSIRGIGRRLSLNSVLIPSNRELGDRTSNRKSPPFAGLSASMGGAFSEPGTGWLGAGGFEPRYGELDSMLSPVREGSQNLFLLKFIGPSKRWNFANRTESAQSRAPEINGTFGE